MFDAKKVVAFYKNHPHLELEDALNLYIECQKCKDKYTSVSSDIIRAYYVYNILTNTRRCVVAKSQSEACKFVADKVGVSEANYNTEICTHFDLTNININNCHDIGPYELRNEFMTIKQIKQQEKYDTLTTLMVDLRAKKEPTKKYLLDNHDKYPVRVRAKTGEEYVVIGYEIMLAIKYAIIANVREPFRYVRTCLFVDDDNSPRFEIIEPEKL